MLAGYLSQVNPSISPLLRYHADVISDIKLSCVFNTSQVTGSFQGISDSLSSKQVSGLFLYAALEFSKRGCGRTQLSHELFSSTVHNTVHHIKNAMHALRICRHKSTFLLKLPTLLWASFFLFLHLCMLHTMYNVHATRSLLCTQPWGCIAFQGSKAKLSRNLTSRSMHALCNASRTSLD